MKRTLTLALMILSLLIFAADSVEAQKTNEDIIGEWTHIGDNGEDITFRFEQNNEGLLYTDQREGVIKILPFTYYVDNGDLAIKFDTGESYLFEVEFLSYNYLSIGGKTHVRN